MSQPSATMNGLVTEPRSVSSATMRPEDLIPRFISELDDRVNEMHYQPAGFEFDSVTLATTIQNAVGAIEARLETEGYYESEDASHDLEELFDLLDDCAGPGLAFGAHEGDGADYGFWPVASDGGDETEPDEDNDDSYGPDEDAITTKDHIRFYQYGKQAFTYREDDAAIRITKGDVKVALGGDASVEAAIRAFCDHQQFWPDAWFISDHGNAHLIDLGGAK